MYKRLKKRFYENLNKSEGFQFDISHSKKNQTFVWILDNDVHIDVGNYYEVINGPIDMEWIRKYNEKYKEVYEE